MIYLSLMGSVRQNARPISWVGKTWRAVGLACLNVEYVTMRQYGLLACRIMYDKVHGASSLLRVGGLRGLFPYSATSSPARRVKFVTRQRDWKV